MYIYLLKTTCLFVFKYHRRAAIGDITAKKARHSRAEAEPLKKKAKVTTPVKEAKKKKKEAKVEKKKLVYLS